MTRYCYVGSLIFACILACSGIIGCGTAKSAVHKVVNLSSRAASSVAGTILPDKPGLKKRVMVLSLIDYSGLAPGLGERVAADFSERLARSDEIVVFRPKNKEEWSIRNKSPRFGIVNDPELVKKAAGLNMNALITGVFDVIKTKTKKTGIWPFRKSWNVYEVLTVINVIDPMTGTLLLSKSESGEFLTHSNPGSMGNKELVEQLFDNALPRVLKKEASLVCEKLEKSPWTGKILAVENDTIKINAGKDVGVDTGCRFEVFERGDAIPSQSGMVYVPVGKKRGEIRVTSVMDTYSLAKPVTKGIFCENQTIRPVIN